MDANLRVFPDAAQAAGWVADRIADKLRSVEGRRAVLGLPTGRTPVPLYAELVRRHREEELSFARATVFNLDEYWPLAPAAPGGFAAYMRKHLVDQVDLPADQFFIPDGACPAEDVEEHCAAYRRAIVDAGGIGLQVLGLGNNGHVGFNEPGSGPGSVTRLVDLAPATVERYAHDFPGQEPPSKGITLGVADILAARRLLVLVTGSDKAAVAERALKGEVGADCPASLLREHAAVTWVLDEAAASELGRC